MYTWWIFLLLGYEIVAEQKGSDLTSDDNEFQTNVDTKKIGRMKYLDGEVIIFQSQQKSTDFFFTPFPFVQPEQTKCHNNILDNRVELGLQFQLYTSQLIQSAKDYLHKHQSSLCGINQTSNVCDVSLIPINSIRLVQRESRLNNTHHLYTLEDSWYSGGLLLQSMEFIIYASNMSVCEQLRQTLTERCRLSSLEFHYSIQGQQIIQHHIKANTEHVLVTTMYNHIHLQFPSSETVLLTASDLNELSKDSTERIIIPLRSQEDFDGLQDPKVIDKLLQQQLSTQQVCANEHDFEYSFLMIGTTGKG